MSNFLIRRLTVFELFEYQRTLMFMIVSGHPDIALESQPSNPLAKFLIIWVKEPGQINYKLEVNFIVII